MVSSEKQTQQKERIIEQAMQMFVSQGIKAVRMDDIAQQLSISKRTLYELFGDKEELLYQALSLYFGQRETLHTELMAKAENVIQAMYRILRDSMSNAEELNRMIVNLQKFHPAIYERLMSDKDGHHRSSFRACLERGISEGLFRNDFNLDLSITMLYKISAAIYSIQEAVVLPEHLSQGEAMMQVMDHYFRGISTAKGVALIDTYTQNENK